MSRPVALGVSMPSLKERTLPGIREGLDGLYSWARLLPYRSNFHHTTAWSPACGVGHQLIESQATVLRPLMPVPTYSVGRQSRASRKRRSSRSRFERQTNRTPKHRLILTFCPSVQTRRFERRLSSELRQVRSSARFWPARSGILRIPLV
jgi:hypothetical protein